MIKEFSLICGSIAALLLVMAFAGKQDTKNAEALDRHARRLAETYAARDGGREYFELKRLALEVKMKEAQERYNRARGKK